MTCPHCHKAMDTAALRLEYERLGRKTECPHCKTPLLLKRYVQPVRTRPKHQSKKDRLKARRAGA